jgi:outer membrane scaffolding protein for murein synthesis (MipA/OmpV family)
VDLLHGQHWHGGLVGTLTWGRSRHDLGSAASQLPTFDTTVQAGVYLEYAPIEPLSLGLRWRRDLQSSGVVYGDLYAEWDLPRLGYVEHSLKGSVEGMNGRGMRRFFGLDPASAAALGQSPYAPGRGASQYTLEYQAFVPTSAHTGVALDFSWGKLSSTARQSPVIQSYGAPVQRSIMAAFVVHY